MKRLAIIGSGDLGQQIAYHARAEKLYDVVGFFDDFAKVGELKHGLPVLGKVDDIDAQYNTATFDCLMVGVGYRHMAGRAALYERFHRSIPFGKVVHTSSYIDSSCSIGDGVFIYPGCVLDMNVVIEENALLNAGCIIAHDSTVGRHAMLAPGVKVAGFVMLSETVILGIGTVVIDNIRIAAGIKTAAGAVVIDNLQQPGLYAGVPAKFKKEI
jgi:sugar O-acyltransferase (sialic acid O-acetyltransferase NeuD family)